MGLMLAGFDEAVDPKRRCVGGPGPGFPAPEVSKLQPRRRTGFRGNGGYRMGTRA